MISTTKLRQYSHIFLYLNSYLGDISEDANEIIHVLYILWVHEKTLFLEINEPKYKNLIIFQKFNETKLPKKRQMHLTFYCCCCLVAQSCLTLATPWTAARQAPLSMRILQARSLEWIAMPSSRGSSQPRVRTQVSYTAGRFFTIWATREVLTFY